MHVCPSEGRKPSSFPNVTAKTSARPAHLREHLDRQAIAEQVITRGGNLRVQQVVVKRAECADDGQARRGEGRRQRSRTWRWMERLLTESFQGGDIATFWTNLGQLAEKVVSAHPRSCHLVCDPAATARKRQQVPAGEVEKPWSGVKKGGWMMPLAGRDENSKPPSAAGMRLVPS